MAADDETRTHVARHDQHALCLFEQRGHVGVGRHLARDLDRRGDVFLCVFTILRFLFHHLCRRLAVRCRGVCDRQRREREHHHDGAQPKQNPFTRFHDHYLRNDNPPQGRSHVYASPMRNSGKDGVALPPRETRRMEGRVVSCPNARENEQGLCCGFGWFCVFVVSFVFVCFSGFFGGFVLGVFFFVVFVRVLWRVVFF